MSRPGFNEQRPRYDITVTENGLQLCCFQSEMLLGLLELRRWLLPSLRGRNIPPDRTLALRRLVSRYAVVAASLAPGRVTAAEYAYDNLVLRISLAS